MCLYSHKWSFNGLMEFGVPYNKFPLCSGIVGQCNDVYYHQYNGSIGGFSTKLEVLSLFVCRRLW